MCGITGIVSQNLNKEDLFNQVKKISENISSRGPDGTNINIEKNIAFAHNRLAILDRNSELSIQPVLDDSKRFMIIHNGEIYNFQKIKDELIKLGHNFQSNTDTEVIIKSYMQWGAESVKKFEGMWAFAIWDDKEKKLFLSRDKFGIKPLYFSFINNNFYFCSEIKGLKVIKSLGYIDKKILNRFVFEEHQKETFYKNIFNLLPGHNLLFKNNNIKIYKWRDDKIIDIDKNKNLVNKFNELFEKSCLEHSFGQRDIALSLSGGLDSTALLYKFKKLDLNVKLFSTVFENTYNDESIYLDIVEKDLNTKIERNHISINDFNSENFIHSIKALDLIWSEPCIGQWLHYKKIREKGFNVCIEGHGADEMLAGYNYHFDEFIKDQFLNNVFFNIHEFNQQKKEIFTSPDDKTIENTKLDIVRLIFRDLKNYSRNYIEKNPLFKAIVKFKSKINKEHYVYLEKKYYNIFNTKLGCLNSKLYEDILVGNMSRHLAQFDRLSMSQGIELRVPFVNKELINFCISIDKNFKINKGLNKFILREAMKKDFPKKIYLRKNKIGFSNPMHEKLSKNISNFIIETARDKLFLNSDLWDGRKISMLIEKNYKSNNYYLVNKFWKYVNAYHLVN